MKWYKFNIFTNKSGRKASNKNVTPGLPDKTYKRTLPKVLENPLCSHRLSFVSLLKERSEWSSSPLRVCVQQIMSEIIFVSLVFMTLIILLGRIRTNTDGRRGSRIWLRSGWGWLAQRLSALGNSDSNSFFVKSYMNLCRNAEISARAGTGHPVLCSCEFFSFFFAKSVDTRNSFRNFAWQLLPHETVTRKSATRCRTSTKQFHSVLWCCRGENLTSLCCWKYRARRAVLKILKTKHAASKEWAVVFFWIRHKRAQRTLPHSDTLHSRDISRYQLSLWSQLIPPPP